MVKGANRPQFFGTQQGFAAHIRNPEINERPADVEPRRMQIYLDLFFNNIESFLASAFPIAKSCLAEDAWLALARAFIHEHGSESPYFLQISEEFLEYLAARGLQGLPDFYLELCHYEWVELSLDVAEVEEADRFSQGEVSVLARPLIYSFPVHEIGPDNQPSHPPNAPSYLVVYRTPSDEVKFIASNAVTHRLLHLLQDHVAEDALHMIAQELQAGAEGQDDARDQAAQKNAIIRQGWEILERLAALKIVRNSWDNS